MTKEEYEVKKKEITARLGLPEYDMGDPMNESAKTLRALATEYRLEKTRITHEEKRKERNELEDIADVARTTFRDKHLKAEDYLSPIYVPEADLKQFNDVERQIVELKLEHRTWSDSRIAKELSITRQVVTAFLQSPAFKWLHNKIKDRLMSFEGWQCLSAAMQSGDAKIALRVLEHYGEISNEKKEIDLNKPITDPGAIKFLKELGDKLIDPEENKE